ncbi:flavin monoamine oxidase family protein [Chromobacterium vaccinii]|uniref:flavin monoamine oxidase family protein n=1 Tax=Chromobacterium vaccinii TaxID=1108595 RepID=UPI000617F551|nr:NAD(P)/FAD-dependent oxidoreductase [Chromobacterium vaccinii]QND84118.1 Tryptophan 2-monooxygenase VioA [Chromobacterium vaccinii]QND89349.1 Tryptophan 2-monooxygenase VioA [Chromobacterium vaccinii]
MKHSSDICIVGAGISGLTCASHLLDSPACRGLSLRIFDMQQEAGGRIRSKTLDGKAAIELGAGRYSPQLHPHFQSAMQHYSQKSEIYPFTQLKFKNHTQQKLKRAMSELSSRLVEHGKESFLQFVSRYQGKESAVGMIRSMGYDALFLPDISAEMAYDIVGKHPEIQSVTDNDANQWFSAEQGFDGLIQQIKTKVKAAGARFSLGYRLVSVEADGDGYRLQLAGDDGWKLEHRTRHLILAVPPSAMAGLNVNFPEAWSGARYGSLPLFKGFLTYSEPWWLDYKLDDQVLIVDNPLRKIYFKGDKYLFFYTDSEMADYWRGCVAEGEDGYLEQIRTHLASALGIARERIPQPRVHVHKYWAHGVEFCRDSGIDHPSALSHRDSGIIACSDAYTTHCGWMEGGLLSAREASRLLLQRLSA